MTGILSALIAALTDSLRNALKFVRLSIIGGPGTVRLGSYVAFSCLCALAGCLACHVWCPTAAGSGVPEVKVVLQGVDKPSLLTMRALWTKEVGLVLALAAGLSVGQEGPNIHIACAVAEILMRNLSCFGSLATNEAKRLDVLGAAAAAGVSASFGTPFAGAIWSIEITASTYNIRMLPQALWCSMAGSILLSSAGLDNLTSIFDPDATGSSTGFSRLDLVAFVALGTLCGVAGALYVAGVAGIATLRNAFIARATTCCARSRRGLVSVADDDDDDATTRAKVSRRGQGGGSRRRRRRRRPGDDEHDDADELASSKSSRSQWSGIVETVRPHAALVGKMTWVLGTTLLVAPFVYHDLMYGLAGTTMDERFNEDVFGLLFDKAAMDATTRTKVLWYVPYKFCATVVSVVVPIPVGLFKPTFITGASLGRAFGEILHAVAVRCADAQWLANLGAQNDDVAPSATSRGDDGPPAMTDFLPWEYAVIGAAAFTSNVTRALSSAILFLELAGENHLRGPLVLTSLIAHFIGSRLTKSIYDSLIDANDIPTLPELRSRLYYKPVRAVMHPIVAVDDLERLLAAGPRGGGEDDVADDDDDDDLGAPRGDDDAKRKALTAETVTQPGGAELADAETKAAATEPPARDTATLSLASIIGTTFQAAERATTVEMAPTTTTPSGYGAILAADHDDVVDVLGAAKEDAGQRPHRSDSNDTPGGGGDTTSPTSPTTTLAQLRRLVLRDEAIPFLRLDSTYADLRALLECRLRVAHLAALAAIPVVQDADQRALVGSVLVSDVRAAVRAFADMLATARRDPLRVGRRRDARGRRRRRRRHGEDASSRRPDRARSRSPRQALRKTSSTPLLVRPREDDEDVASTLSSPRAGHASSSRSRAFVTTTSQRSRSRSPRAQRHNSLDDDLDDDDDVAPHEHVVDEAPVSDEEARGTMDAAWLAAVHFVVNHGGRAVPVASSAAARRPAHRRPVGQFFALAPGVSVLLDASPYQILDTMALAKVDLIFRSLKVNNGYVTCSGDLVGVVTRARLRHVLADNVKHPWCTASRCCVGGTPRDRRGGVFGDDDDDDADDDDGDGAPDDDEDDIEAHRRISFDDQLPRRHRPVGPHAHDHDPLLLRPMESFHF